MSINKRIKILSEIGNSFNEIANGKQIDAFPGFESVFNHNPWFTSENVKYSLQEWSNLLSEKNLNSWISTYNIPDNYSSSVKLGIIMAGNIPFVGLHDLICGYILGVKLRIKLSSKDTVLMKWFIDSIKERDNDFSDKIIIFEELISDFNTVIATGSNSSNQYFEYYFKSYPKILRHNRSSIAVLTGKETNEELEALGDDIFTYFGLGCRNVTSLRIPEGFEFAPLAEAFKKYQNAIDNNKYANNFNYQYTIIAMNRILHVNLHNLLLLESPSLHSPVSIVNYQYYSDIKNLNKELHQHKDDIQCIVSNSEDIDSRVDFGQTQKPSLSDYADNIDTIEFLLNLQQ